MRYYIQLIASNNTCSDTASKYIDVDDDCSIYLPNAFTPSGANINDYFCPVIIGYSDKNYLFEVFDRWGEKIFSTSDINSKGWDGTYKGKLCMDNTYVWKLVATSLKGEKKELMGHVMLFRN
jgi:gliding motility-associated-like protein